MNLSLRQQICITDGVLLVGDIPNTSLKQRFLSSDYGKKFDENWKNQFQHSQPHLQNILV